MSGMAKGVLYSLAPMIYFFQKAQTDRLLVVLIGAVLTALYLEYIMYRRNMSDHKILSRRLGSKYRDEVETALAELGLYTMLQRRWFTKRYKKVYDI